MVKGLGVGLAANLAASSLISIRSGARGSWHGTAIDPLHKGGPFVRLDPAPGYVAAMASAHPIRSLTLQNWITPAPIDAGAVLEIRLLMRCRPWTTIRNCAMFAM